MNIPNLFLQKQPKISNLAAYPASYQAYLQHPHPIFLEKYRLPTLEPTRDGLDYLECHYLMEAMASPSEKPYLNQLPTDFLPFSVTDTAYLAFDLRQNQVEPAIFLIDLEMDQWLKVADNFSEFLAQLTYAPLSLPLEDEEWQLDFPELKLWHYLGIASPTEAENLLHLLENDFQKSAYLDWLAYYLHKPTEYALVVLEAFNTQMLYFQAQLDKLACHQLITAFKQLPQLKTQLTTFQKDW